MRGLPKYLPKHGGPFHRCDFDKGDSLEVAAFSLNVTCVVLVLSIFSHRVAGVNSVTERRRPLFLFSYQI